MVDPSDCKIPHMADALWSTGLWMVCKLSTRICCLFRILIVLSSARELWKWCYENVRPCRNRVDCDNFAMNIFLCLFFKLFWYILLELPRMGWLWALRFIEYAYNAPNVTDLFCIRCLECTDEDVDWRHAPIGGTYGVICVRRGTRQQQRNQRVGDPMTSPEHCLFNDCNAKYVALYELWELS